MAHARAVDADILVAKQGLTVEESVIDEESGEKIVLKIRNHPAITTSNQSWRLVHRFCSEFGLSPVSRTRLTIEKKDSAEGELLAALSKPRESRISVN